MYAYIVRRFLYMIPILIGVNLFTFSLFFLVNSPENLARFNLGSKHVTEEALELWKQKRGYDLPLFFNTLETGHHQYTRTIFFQKSLKMFLFDFGLSDAGRNITEDLRTRMWPSIAIALPTLFFGLAVNILFSLMVVFFRGTYLDLTMGILCVVLMSISTLFYIIAGQFFFSKTMRLFPISGYAYDLNFIKFITLPILIGIVSGIGTGTRWYRILLLEEVNKDYVRTARSKGLSEYQVLLKHVLRNALIPILTGVIAILPLLFLGSLLMESFFGIPGLGSYTIDAIAQQDFAIVRSIVFLGSFLYVLGLLLTDISYTFVDPRVRFH